MFVGFALLRASTSRFAGGYRQKDQRNWTGAISLCVVPLVSFQTTYVSVKLRIYAKISRGWSAGTYIQKASSALAVALREKTSKLKGTRAKPRKPPRRWPTTFTFNSPLMSFALLLSMAGILWYGGRLVITGVITQGQMAEFLLYVVMLNMPVRTLGWLTTLY
jgi:ABC-type multidrug transport system fused ATPase/permease subunit